VSPSYPHAYNVWNITEESLDHAMSFCKEAPARAYVHLCVEGLIHSHEHLSNLLPFRSFGGQKGAWHTNSTHLAVNSLTYICAKMGRLAPPCLRYFFLERFDLAYGSWVASPAGFQTFFQACNAAGPACINALSKHSYVVLEDLAEGRITANNIHSTTFELELIAPLLRRSFCRSNLLVCFCSAFFGEQPWRDRDLSADDKVRWLACVHGCMSSISIRTFTANSTSAFSPAWVHTRCAQLNSLPWSNALRSAVLQFCTRWGSCHVQSLQVDAMDYAGSAVELWDNIRNPLEY